MEVKWRHMCTAQNKLEPLKTPEMDEDGEMAAWRWREMITDSHTWKLQKVVGISLRKREMKTEFISACCGSLFVNQITEIFQNAMNFKLWLQYFISSFTLVQKQNHLSFCILMCCNVLWKWIHFAFVSFIQSSTCCSNKNKWKKYEKQTCGGCKTVVAVNSKKPKYHHWLPGLTLLTKKEEH